MKLSASRRPVALAATLVALAAATSPTLAATTTATTQWLCGSGDWATATCWTGGALPGGNSNVVIDNLLGRVDLGLAGITNLNSLMLQWTPGSSSAAVSMVQNGGVVNVLGTIANGDRGNASVWIGVGGTASYELASGSFSAGLMRIGDSTGNLVGTGRFTLLDGSLQTTSTSIGRDGSGQLLQSGGDFHTGSLSLGSLTYNVLGAVPSALYQATGGTLLVDNSVGVGNGGAGLVARMELAGNASARIQQELRVSAPSGSATLTMSETSRLQADRVRIGADGGPGTATLSDAATLTVRELTVGDARTKYLLSPGLAPQVPTSVLTIGAATSDAAPQLTGTTAYIGRSSDARVIQAGNSRVSFSGDVVLADTGLGSASYTVQGGSFRAATLNLGWSTNYLNFLSQTGPAAFTQSAGSVDVQTLKIGRQASYQLAGGTLSVAGDVVNDGSFSATGGSFTIGGNVTNNGRWTVAAAEQHFTGATLFGAGSQTHLAADSTATFEGLVTERTGAIFTGSGTKVFLGGLSVGASPGSVVESGNVTFGGANSYTAEIGGLVAGTGFDHYRVNGQLTLNGALVVTSWNGFIAQAGQQFDLLDWGTLSGQFATVDIQGLQLAPGTALDLSRLYVDGTVAVVAVPEPASRALWLVGAALLAMGATRRRNRQS